MHLIIFKRPPYTGVQLATFQEWIKVACDGEPFINIQKLSEFNVWLKVDVMSSFLKVAIMSASQVRKVKQLNTKQLAEIQFDYGF